MKFRLGATCAALAFAVLSARVAGAQSTDAFVLPPGMLRLSVEASHASFESAFDAAGERSPLASGLGGPLDPTRFIALQPLASALQNFFAGTSGAPIEPGGVTLGTLDLQAAGSRTDTRLGLGFGILPRVEIGGSVVIHRGGRTIQRFGLEGGMLGVNPDASGNQAILERIGWGTLGASPLLPVADSPEGIELQNRATALAGDPLNLPADTAGIEVLQALLQQQYGLAPIGSGVDPYRLGDTEVYARVLVLSTMGRAPYPPSGAGLHLRVSGFGGARIATGQQADTLRLVAPPADSPIGGFFAGGAADLFLGSRFWGTGAVRFSSYAAADVLRRQAPADAPFSTTASPALFTVTPGNRLELHLAPRYRLTESIALGVQYAAATVGDSEFEGATLPALAGGTAQRLGLGIRYSSLAAYWDRRAAFPADISLEYLRTLGGPEGEIGAGMVRLQVNLLPQLYGRVTRED